MYVWALLKKINTSAPAKKEIERGGGTRKRQREREREREKGICAILWGKGLS